jgi:hypothetical protein
MEIISDNPEGSDPSDYLSPEDAETVRKFHGLYDSLNWLEADQLEGMKTGPSDRIPGWKEAEHVAKAALTKRLFYRHPAGGEPQPGIIFAKLSTSNPRQLVALRADGKLVSKRGTELEKSYGIGWGKLPDKDIMEPALPAGCSYGVDYTNANSLSLNDILVGSLSKRLSNSEDNRVKQLLAERSLADRVADFGLTMPGK